MAMARSQNESFAEDTYFGDCYLCLLLIEDVSEISFNFIIVSHWANHEELSSIRTHQNFSFIKPAMGCKISILRQFLNLFCRLKRIILDFVELEKIFTAN